MHPISLDEIAIYATAPAGAWWLSGFLLLLAAITFLTFRLRMSPLLVEMRQACEVIEALPDAQALARHLNEVDDQIGSGKLLGVAWREFRASLLLPEPEDLPQEPETDPHDQELHSSQLLATRDPAISFPGERLLSAHMNLRFYHAMPNLLVGMGILGTFVGLLFGIHVASRGLAATDMAVARAALQGLLSAAALKFSTSVSGLLASLLFSWREKHWLHRFDALTRRFSAALEARLIRVTQEALALNSLRAATRRESLLEILPARVGESVASYLIPQFESLALSLEERERSTADRLERIAHNFSRALSGMASGTGDTARLASALERMSLALESQNVTPFSNEAVQELSSGFREGGALIKQDLTEALGTILQRLSNAIEAMTHQLAAAGANAAQDLDRAAGGVDAAGGRLAVAMNGMGTAVESFSRFGGEAENILLGLREVHAGFSATVLPLGNVANAFQNSATKIEGSAVKIQEVATGLQAAISELTHLETQVCAQWQEYEGRFGQVDLSLANTFREMEGSLAKTTVMVRDWVGELDQHTSTIVRELSVAAGEIRETVSDLAQVLAEPRA
ncbi:hypothetical protein CCP3SC1AL1_100008 [Gammaproteobacteria bacterium]